MTGKNITLKDIFSVKQHANKRLKNNYLQYVVKYLEKQAGFTMEIIADVDNNLKRLFYKAQ